MPRSVLEANLPEVCFAAAILWRVVACDPLAPLAGSEADEGGVVLVPFDDPLPEVARPLLTHRGVRLKQLVQPIKADPSRCWEFPRVPGREVTHDELDKFLLQVHDMRSRGRPRCRHAAAR